MDQHAGMLGAQILPEFRRDYCTVHSTDCTMADLLAIAQTQQAMISAAKRRSKGPVVTDTDARMTAVWASMMLGTRDPWLERLDATADLDLLLDMALSFVGDGLRLYGDEAERRRFFDLCRAELMRRGAG